MGLRFGVSAVGRGGLLGGTQLGCELSSSCAEAACTGVRPLRASPLAAAADPFLEEGPKAPWGSPGRFLAGESSFRGAASRPEAVRTLADIRMASLAGNHQAGTLKK